MLEKETMDMIQKKNVLIFGVEEEDIMDDNYFVSITDSSSECRFSLLSNV